MAPITCPTPGCPGTSFDSTGSETICMVCGSVVANTSLVSDVEFQEGAGGSSSAVGQFVGVDGGGGRSALGGRGVFSRASKEITIAAARQMINLMGNALKVPDYIRNVAVNFYSMALSRNLTMGKRRPVVLSVCLYMACRVEGSSHLIVDFADLIKVPVADLGTSFLSMSKKLCIRLPVPDPSLYLFRFVHTLGYAEKAHMIGTTAGRILARMKSDWMNVGRKPSGLCAAAIFIAGKLHKDERTLEELLKVVKIHQSTLRKRLKEFGETSASSLTVEDFLGPALDHLPCETEPPILKTRRAAELLKEDEEILRLMQGDDEDVDREEEEDVLRRIGGKASFDTVYKEITRLLDAGAQEQEAGATGVWQEFVKDLETCCAQETDDIMKFLLEEDVAGLKEAAEEDQIVPVEFGDTKPDVKFGPLPDFLQLKPNANAPKKSFDHLPQWEPPEENRNGELDLDGIDDAELDVYILSKEEAKMKAMLWFKVNGGYIKEQEVKRMFNDTEGEGKKTPKRTKRKASQENRLRRDDNFSQVAKKKKLSKLINLDVLKELESSDSAVPVKKDEEDTSGVDKKREDESVGEKGLVGHKNRSSFNEYRARFAKKNLLLVNQDVKPDGVEDENKTKKKEDIVDVEQKEEVKSEPKLEPEELFIDEDEEEEQEDVGARALLAQFSGGVDAAEDSYYDYDAY